MDFLGDQDVNYYEPNRDQSRGLLPVTAATPAKNRLLYPLCCSRLADHE